MVHIYVGMCTVCIRQCPQSHKRVRYLRPGVADGCELPMGPAIHVQVLCKGSQCSKLLSHLSSSVVALIHQLIRRSQNRNSEMIKVPQKVTVKERTGMLDMRQTITLQEKAHYLSLELKGAQ